MRQHCKASVPGGIDIQIPQSSQRFRWFGRNDRIHVKNQDDGLWVEPNHVFQR